MLANYPIQTNIAALHTTNNQHRTITIGVWLRTIPYTHNLTMWGGSHQLTNLAGAPDQRRSPNPRSAGRTLDRRQRCDRRFYRSVREDTLLPQASKLPCWQSDS